MTQENGHKLRRIVLIGCILVILTTTAGCGELIETETSTATTSATSTVSGSASHTTTNTPPSTPETTSTFTETPKRSISEKYSYFREGYISSLENKSVVITNNSIDATNETLHITYEMENPTNDTSTGQERENISLLYVVGVEVYLNQTATPNVDKTWIPKQVNVTAVTPSGELYETAYTTFELAKKMIDGEISEKRYLLEYYSTIEPGPANPEYEG